MDKIIFLQELCSISGEDSINRVNFDYAMQFDHSLNLFYEAICEIAKQYNSSGEIVVSSIDFSKFTVPPGSFYFSFSQKIHKVIEDGTVINCPSGCCTIYKNNEAEGYIVNTQLNGRI